MTRGEAVLTAGRRLLSQRKRFPKLRFSKVWIG